jgi:molecular chaperone IbpA
MRTFDLTPLYRSTVGFDRLFSMLDGFDAAPGYPPYNIERTSENEYRISVAVAGFADTDLSVEAKENTLTITGAKKQNEEKAGEVLYQGIAARAFERVFQLADYVQVKGATVENGLLHVDLVREIPEAKKPRAIRITSGSANKPKAVEARAA